MNILLTNILNKGALLCTYLNCFHLTMRLPFVFLVTDKYPVRKALNFSVTNEMFFSEAAVLPH